MIRIAALALLLLGNVSFAQEGGEDPADKHAETKPNPVPRTPPEQREARASGPRAAPKTCEQKCERVVEPCENSCKRVKNPAAKQSCNKRCGDLDSACSGSCQEKGRIDPKYLQEKLTPKK